MRSFSCVVLAPVRAVFQRAARPRIRASIVLRATPAMGIISALAVAGLGAPAAAAFTTLSGQVFTSTPGTLQQASFIDAPVASFSALRALDTIGNDGVANGSLSAPGGIFTMSSHACSGGPPGFGGQANAAAHCDVTQDFTITSATLPPGTPVMVSIRWAVAGRVTAIGAPLTHHNAGATASLDGRVAITVNGVSVINRLGSASRSHNLFSGFTYSPAGALDVEGDSDEHVVAVPIGQAIRVTMIGNASGSTIALLSSVTQGDAQLSMVWGLTSLDPNASAVSLTYPGQPAPPAAMATPAHAISILPARPLASPQCFGFQSQPLAAATCPAGTAAFSASALGAGPFTYQWQIETAPGSWQALGSTPSPLACGPGALAFATPTNSPTVSIGVLNCAGPFRVRCLITNPCGSLASNEVALRLSSCPGDADANFMVGLSDVAAIISCWSMPASCNICADLDQDGTIGLGDIAQAVQNWATTCP